LRTLLVTAFFGSSVDKRKVSDSTLP